MAIEGAQRFPGAEEDFLSRFRVGLLFDMSGESFSNKRTLKVSTESAVLLSKVEDSKAQLSVPPEEAPLPSVFAHLSEELPEPSLRVEPPPTPPTSSSMPQARWIGLARGLVPLLGLALALGMSAVSVSRSSVEDAHHIAKKAPDQRWDIPEVEVVLDDSLGFLGPQIEEIITASFSTWEKTGAEVPRVRFVWGEGAVASLEPDGKSTVLLSPIEFEGHESDLAITIGFSNPQNGEVSEADIVINSAHVFSSVPEFAVLQSGRMAGAVFTPAEQESCAGSLDARGCESSYDLQNVMTHEVGHFFGLGENFDDTRATMFSCTSACETHKRDLSHADTDSIVRLYRARPEPVAAGCVGVQIGGDTLRPRLGLFTGLALFFLLVLFRRRYATELPATHPGFGAASRDL